MRYVLAVVIVLFLCPRQLWAEEDPNFFYAVTFQGGMTVTRYAKPEYADSVRASRPDGVNVTWVFQSSGGPGETDANVEIAAINQVVSQVLLSHKGAVLALTSIQANKQGLWAFYTNDGAALASGLEMGLKGKTQGPVRVRTGRDPEWKALAGFVARLREEK